MLSLIVRKKAEEDLLSAVIWYDSQKRGLGGDFLLEIEHVFGTISANPAMFPVVYKEIRRALVRRFPYAVFYIEASENVVVLAVTHCKRHPRRWKKRK